MKRKELQERIAEITLEVHNGESLRLSVSAGAAIFPGDGATYETLLATADHRMYRDKHARHGPPTVRRPTPVAAPAANVHAFEPVAALRAAR
jgi:GGDEF domain-containing protein